MKKIMKRGKNCWGKVVVNHKLQISVALAIVFTTQCTTYDSSPSQEEQDRINNAELFESLDGDLTLNADGQYSYKGQPLKAEADVNGMPAYADINLNGTDYIVLSAGYDANRSLYFLSEEEQFGDIGATLPLMTEVNGSVATSFSGKFNERTLASGEFSEVRSGAIVLSFDPDNGTLDSLYGPDIHYQWDGKTFAGVNGTKGEAIITSGDIPATQESLGNYQLADEAGETFGVYWSIREE